MKNIELNLMKKKKIMKYKLLSGEIIKLESLTTRQRNFLHTLRQMVKDDECYFEVCQFAVGPGSPAMQGRNCVNPSLLKSPLYLVARDIATRLGIKQHLILAPEFEELRSKAPKDSSQLNLFQAANFIGISRAAVLDAINKNKLKALEIGNVILVEKVSAIEYRSEINSMKPMQHISSREKQSRSEASKPHAALASKIK